MCQNYLKINQNKTEVIVFHPTTKVSIALVDSINIKSESEMLGECNFVKISDLFQHYVYGVFHFQKMSNLCLSS